MKLLPRSLAARLILLLLLALAVAQGVSVLLLVDERRVAVATALHSQVLNQTVTVARLLVAMPEPLRPAVVAAANSRDTCFAVSNERPAVGQPARGERHLSGRLRRMLHGVPVNEVAVRVGDIDREPMLCRDWDRSAAARPQRFFGPRVGLFIVVGMPRGWLTVEAAVPTTHAWTPVTIASMAIMAVAIVAIVILTLRRLTRPLRQLTAAAERLGRGEQADPVPETGPQEVAGAARAFNTMQERLTRFVNDRTRLLAAISHDLRTPLTSLRLRAEFVEDPENREKIIETIEEIQRMAEATLLFTKGEATAEPTRVVDLTAMARDIAGDFVAHGRTVDVSGPPGLMYPCREGGLRRALRNLVENAVRYGERTEISVEDTAEGPRIAVSDNGPGIPEQSLAEVFKPFFRLDPSRSRDLGGVGLGLAIARNVVRGHGGELTLANRKDGGLSARIALPRWSGR